MRAIMSYEIVGTDHEGGPEPELLPFTKEDIDAIIGRAKERAYELGDYQTALGRFNVDETEFDMRNLFVLGNGTDTNNRSNTMAVDVAGNLNMNQDVVANAFVDSPISLVELSNRIGLIEEKLAKLTILE